MEYAPYQFNEPAAFKKIKPIPAGDWHRASSKSGIQLKVRSGISQIA